MELRKYRRADLPAVLRIIRETILTVNEKEYTQTQLRAWASCFEDERVWADRFQSGSAWVVIMDGELAGCSLLTKDGVADLLFVHKDYLRRGAASRLLWKMEAEASTRHDYLRTEASLTALPFFQVMGFKVVERQIKITKGISIKNIKMCKKLNT
ncbi:GNAT family N-acetyltransferase [Halobacillus rhizosphaerae]|uniref:GNAT family N-acetyltransferase n=1 Tax=Halobacillus rhizosphaerae TaxID=3064889 RepID=UPI00398B4A07